MHMPTVNLCTTDPIIKSVIGMVFVISGLLGATQVGNIFLQSVFLFFTGLNIVSVLIGWWPVYRPVIIFSYNI
ncbi:MAG: hypothetical protein ACI8R9_000229 [Paraglaciecola sp.]|jgi:hypothetical protein